MSAFRKLYFIACIACFMYVQEIKGQQLINTTGNSITDGSVNIEYAIGEIAITTLFTGNNNITQGLLQPLVQFISAPCAMIDFVPNAFTPNSDGVNDCYGISQWPFVSSFELSIFNRWGELIFKATDPSDCWDGKFKGKDQPIGVYVYMIRATGQCGPTFKKGTFLLIR